MSKIAMQNRPPILLERFNPTLDYMLTSKTLSSIRDVFFLLGGKKYDETLYRLIIIIQKTRKDDTLIGSLKALKGNSDSITLCLNQIYLEALKDTNVSIKQIKKIRHALYEFALANNLNLNILISDKDKLFEKKKLEHKKQKYAKSKKVLNKNKIISLMDNASPTQINSYDDLQDKLKNLNNSLTVTAGKLSLKKLLQLRHTLQQAYQDLRLNPDLATINHLITKRMQEEKQADAIAYSKVKKTMECLRDKTILTGLRYKLIKPFWDKEGDATVFKIINHLDNLGLHHETKGLINIFLQLEVNTTNSTAHYREQLQKFLYALYALFNTLSLREDININDLKELKKLIHIFAEQNHFDKKLFNLRKTYKKHLDDNTVGLKLESQPHRKYAYIDTLSNEITYKKLQLRNRKKWLNRLSIAVSILIGVGEGLVAAVFLGWLLIPSLLIVGTAGFAVNYFLFRHDSFATLKQFFVSGLFKDQFGNEISKGKKIAISMTILSSLAAATIFALFAYSSAFAAVTGLLAAASIACPPVALAVAGVLAVAALIAFACVFYCGIADFIKNDRLKQIGNYLKKNFLEIWYQPEMWKSTKPTIQQKIAHYAGAAAKFMVRSIFLLGALALCGLITATTLGLGHSHAIAILKQIPKLSAKTINLIAMIGVYVCAAPVNSFFYWKGIINTMMNTIGAGVIAVGKTIISPPSAKSIKQGWKNFKENKLQSINLIFSGISRIILIGCAFVNGAGLAGGPYHSSESINNIKKATKMRSTTMAADTCAGVAGFASFSLNTTSILHATKVPDAALGIEEIEMSEIKRPSHQDILLELGNESKTITREPDLIATKTNRSNYLSFFEYLRTAKEQPKSFIECSSELSNDYKNTDAITHALSL